MYEMMMLEDMMNIEGGEAEENTIWLEGGESENTIWLDYNDFMLQNTKESIAGFSANFGGTDIFSPLKSAFAQQAPQGYKKRIFVLTDGEDCNLE